MRTLDATDMQSSIVDSETNRREPATALKVLIVEDNHQYGDLLGAQLADAGHSIVIARDARSALDLARTFMPDAVLVDNELPETGAFGFARMLRNERILPATSIVIVVTGDPADQLEDAIEVGANLLLRKPFAAQALPGLIGCVHALRQRKLRFASPITERQCA